MKLSSPPHFRSRDDFLCTLPFMVHTAVQTPPSSVWAAWSGVFPCSCRRRYTPGRCSCRPPPAFGSASFWVSFRSPKAGMVRHCRQAWQAKDCLFRTAGTSRRSSACLSAGVRQPAALSWFVPNTFRPAASGVRTPHTGGAFPSASPRSYDKLLISSIMTSNMLCKVRVKVGL